MRYRFVKAGSRFLWAGNFPCKLIKKGGFWYIHKNVSFKSKFFRQISILNVFVNDSVGFKHKRGYKSVHFMFVVKHILIMLARLKKSHVKAR